MCPGAVAVTRTSLCQCELPSCLCQMFNSNNCPGSPILTPTLTQGLGPSWDDQSREAGSSRYDCPQFLGRSREAPLPSLTY